MCQALLEELELSLPFRESSLEFVRHNISDHRIEDILGVTAARNHPACVLKVRDNVIPPLLQIGIFGGDAIPPGIK